MWALARFNFSADSPPLFSLSDSHARRLIIEWWLLWEMIREQTYHMQTAKTAEKAKNSLVLQTRADDS